PGAGLQPAAEPALPAGEREARRRVLDVSPAVDLPGRHTVHRARLPRGASLLVPTGAVGTAGVARLADRRAHRMQPGPERVDQHAHDARLVSGAAADVEHALPRRASPLSVDPVSPAAGVASRGARRVASPRFRLCGRPPGDYPGPIALRGSGH